MNKQEKIKNKNANYCDGDVTCKDEIQERSQKYRLKASTNQSGGVQGGGRGGNHLQQDVHTPTDSFLSL